MRTTCAAVVLCVRSHARRHAIPGSLPQLPVSVGGMLARGRLVARNKGLLPPVPLHARLLREGAARARPGGNRGNRSDQPSLTAVKIMLRATVSVIAANPTVCSRVRNAAGSSGL